MTKSKQIHPFLDDKEDQNVHDLLLKNTNADFPVRHLVDTESSDFKTEEEKTPKPSLVQKRKSAATRVQPETEPEMLSSFTQWLLSLKPTAFQEEEPVTSARSVADVDEESLVKSPKKKKKKKTKKKEAKLREAKEAAQHSMKTDIVSDTLAELIASQGHVEEAIRMYHRLVTLHPEKAAFYIQRITELRQGKE